MIPARLRSPWLLLMFLPLGPSCGGPGGDGTDSGNALTLVVGSEGQAIESRDVASITAAWMTVAEAEFAPCAAGGGEDEDAEIDYPGPLYVDLLANTALAEIDLSFDVVCELEFTVEPGPAEAPAPFADASIVVEGRSAAGVDFVLTSAGDWEFELEEELPLTEALSRFALVFDLDAWFDGVDPDLGEIGDDLIRIDAANNADLLGLFEANVTTSARLIDQT